MRPSSVAFAALSLLSGAAVIAAVAEGCALPSFTLQIPVDAGKDAQEEAAPQGGTPAGYPDPPPAGDGGPSLPAPLVFALRSIDLGDMGATPPGYDLDHVCTCFQDAGLSCVGQSSQITTYCDQPPNLGIDNQAAKLFQLIELPVGPSVFSSSVFSLEANAGHWSMLFRVDGYNGMPDDPEVDVAIFPAGGLGVTPLWNGNDAWPVVSSSVADGGLSNPKFRSNGAYVSQGTLVATMPTAEISIDGGGLDTITIRLSAGVITGKLEQVNGLWYLKNGIVAARWALKDVFIALGSYRDDKGKPFCTDQTLAYSLAKGAICSDADILVDGTQPKSAPCDALSVGLGFEAFPAVLGGVTDAGALTDGCPPATDPSNDKCN